MNLTGKGSWTQVPLIIEVANSYGQRKFSKAEPDKVTHIGCIPMVDQTNLDPEKVLSGEQTADTNPWLNTRLVEVPDRQNEGQTRRIQDRIVNLTVGQVEMLQEMGETFTDERGHVFIGGVKADLFKNEGTGKILPNTKEGHVNAFDRAAEGFPPFEPAVLETANAVRDAAWQKYNADKAAERAAEIPVDEVEETAEVEQVVEDQGPEIC